ncbi:MerR family transcriptional regulator [Rhodovibrionaceae bacterium A322]
MEMKTWISIGELADQSKVSHRTLRFYEELGLLSPLRDPFNDRRRYSKEDLIAVQNITLLKGIGLSLKEIQKLTSSRTPDVEGLLSLQLQLLQEQKRELDATIRSITQAAVKVGQGESLSLAELCHLIRRTNMSLQTQDQVYKKYLSDEQIKQLQQATSGLDSDQARDLAQAWKDLIEEATKLLGSDPTGPAAQDLAERWWAVLLKKTGGDMELILNIKAMADDMESWPDEMERPFSPQVRDFMNAALTHRHQKMQANVGIQN